eukprot:1906651-Ditylum_brightwellii.AAC.1
MFQLVNYLMSKMNSWPRKPHHTCTLLHAAIWGCTEEEEPNQEGISNELPEVMIASATITINVMETHWGMEMGKIATLANGSEKDWNLRMGLYHISYWVSKAMSLYGYVTTNYNDGRCNR